MPCEFVAACDRTAFLLHVVFEFSGCDIVMKLSFGYAIFMPTDGAVMDWLSQGGDRLGSESEVCENVMFGYRGVLSPIMGVFSICLVGIIDVEEVKVDYYIK